MANEGILMSCDNFPPAWPPCLVPPTSASVDISVSKNESFNEVFQYDDPTITYWNLTGKTFVMSIKGDFNQTALLTLNNTAFTVIDPVLRILQVTASVAAMQAVLVPGTSYLYDILMTETSSGIVTQIQHGYFNYTEGVS